jgi:hypothetical protein
MMMTIPPDVESWAADLVRAGRFETVEEALMDTIRARLALDDDFAWAKPSLEDARAQASRGETCDRADVSRAMRGARDGHPRRD